jgi:hypothetical protein
VALVINVIRVFHVVVMDNGSPGSHWGATMRGMCLSTLLVSAVSRAIVNVAVARAVGEVAARDHLEFDPAARAGGFALTSTRERADPVGGDLRTSSVPGRGTEVEAML